MSDHYDADDLAPYDPNSPVEGVGSGPGMGANLYYLYKAGQIEMPSIAQRYLGFTHLVHASASSADGYAPTAGSPAALTGLADVLDLLHNALGSTVTSVRDCGVVLSQIAQDYASTDDEAAEAFNDRIRDIDSEADPGGDDFSGPPRTVPDPPMVDGPLPTTTPSTKPPSLDDPPTPDVPDVESPDDEGGSDDDYGSTD